MITLHSLDPDPDPWAPDYVLGHARTLLPPTCFFVPVSIAWCGDSYAVGHRVVYTRGAWLDLVGSTRTLDALYGAGALHAYSPDGPVVPCLLRARHADRASLRQAYEELEGVIRTYSDDVLAWSAPDPGSGTELIGARGGGRAASDIRSKKVMPLPQLRDAIFHWATRKITIKLYMDNTRYAAAVIWAAGRLLTSSGSSITNWIRLFVRMPDLIKTQITYIVRSEAKKIGRGRQSYLTGVNWKLIEKMMRGSKKLLNTKIADKLIAGKIRTRMINTINIYYELKDMLKTGKLKTLSGIRTL